MAILRPYLRNGEKISIIIVMSLVIRLTQTGKRGERKYRIVVKEKRSKRDGKAVAYLGWYEKTATSSKKVIDMEKVRYWVSKGAQTTPSVKELLQK